jgi:regulator of sigma E protease
MFALSSIFWFVLVAGILVAFHEWGHFWVARRFGVKIIRYSIGMGRVLWRRKGRDGTEFVRRICRDYSTRRHCGRES